MAKYVTLTALLLDATEVNVICELHTNSVNYIHTYKGPRTYVYTPVSALMSTYKQDYVSILRLI